MSLLNRPAAGAVVGETVASVREYEAAQKTVSKLIAGDVPARDIAIVGQGVRTIERITGRLGYAAAARSGAVNGVLIGLLLSAILVIGNPDAPIQLFVGFVFIGVALGMILSLVTYAIVRRRRDFASVTQLAADHYEVTVLPASLAKAREVVGDQRTVVVRPPVDLTEPPRYGERVDPGAKPAADASTDANTDASTDASSEAGAGSVGGHVIPPRPADPAPRFGERASDDSASDASTADALTADAGASDESGEPVETTAESDSPAEEPGDKA
ncbi:general stress protein [Microbacterium sp. A93]|uniref:general stress protein n=1 Tax=Microbacterium sp. A93 TaxID=3450716 RepID=UPI003F442FC9